MFNKYSSLTNHYEGKFINGIVMNGLADGAWVAREKIHGANFSFLTKNGADVVPAKRTAEILPGESFYACENVVLKYQDAIRLLWHTFFVTGAYDTLEIQVYGELAGGGVQKDVDYGEKDFYAFDMTVNGEYVPDNIMSTMCRACGLKMAPLLGVGSFEDIKKIPLTFISVVNQYNLDQAEKHSNAGPEKTYVVTEVTEDLENANIAEGYVIKPIKPVWMHNGSRVAIKCKTSKFTEKKNKQANAFNAPVNLSDADKSALEEMVTYLTENRVKNVLSKIDRSSLSAKDFGRVMGLTVQDAIEEIDRSVEGGFLAQFENPSMAKKHFVKEAQDLVRSRWGEILKNEF